MPYIITHIALYRKKVVSLCPFTFQGNKMLTLLKTVTILYIEDDDKTRENMREILSFYSENVHVASNGIDFIKKFRENNLYTPLIVTTAFATTDYLLSCANLNIQGYLLKPVTKAGIKKSLKSAIRYIREIIVRSSFEK